MGAERARSDVVDHEAQMVNARVARRVPGTLARVLSPGLEDREIDVPVGKVHARSRLADLLQAEHVLVEGRDLLGVRSANGDVLDPGHWTSFLSSFYDVDIRRGIFFWVSSSSRVKSAFRRSRSCFSS